ncbi:MAG: sulfotransferase [Desulfarculaceae bacterium]|nr:sulfotransferase [Desulfarculaceae bacterium]
MTPWTNWALQSLACLPGVVVFVELFRALPLMENLNHLKMTTQKVMGVVRSSRISDHWKEKILPHYAGGILAASLLNVVYIAIMAAGFALAFCLVGMWFLGGFAQTAAMLLEPSVQIIAAVLGMAYAVARVKLTPEQGNDYHLGSKLLHHLALDSRLVRKAAFDLDCSLASARKLPKPSGPPVFVTGLARAGTTILLEAIYASGRFATLTYRDMPFITAPNLWKSISSGRRQHAELKERAHKDRLLVNYDSPEAFEEIFWMTFDRDNYVKERHLAPHKPPREVLIQYRRYVSNIIAKDSGKAPLRYLAKNNSNLLRIASLKRAFPEAVILVPFRNPLDHAKSLMVQHQRFVKTHQEDPFSLRYMNWLGHHEFGANLKPFLFCDEALPSSPEELDDFSYWVRYWGCVYDYVLNKHADDIVLFDYDRFCRQPAACLEELAPILHLDKEQLEPFFSKVKSSTLHDHPPVDPTVLAQAEAVHQALHQRVMAEAKELPIVSRIPEAHKAD